MLVEGHGACLPPIAGCPTINGTKAWKKYYERNHGLHKFYSYNLSFTGNQNNGNGGGEIYLTLGSHGRLLCEYELSYKTGHNIHKPVIYIERLVFKHVDLKLLLKFI